MYNVMSTQLLFVDSKNRDSNIYTSGNSYTVHLTFPIKNIESVELVSARVPNTMYNLNNGSGVLSVSGTSYDLNPGFYSVNGLAQALSLLGITVTYLQNEGHFIFSNPSPFTLLISSIELGTMLGLPVGTYTSSLALATDPSYSGLSVVRSATLINMSINEYLYLDIEEFRTPTHVATGAIVDSSGTTSGANTGRAFAPIIMDCISGSIKTFKEQSDYKIRVEYPEPIYSLQRLTIRWLDQYGNLLNFQGWETNAFVIRLYLKPDVEPTPPAPPLQETELKRIIDAMTFSIPPPLEEKKRRIPWFLIILVLLVSYAGYRTYQMALPPLAVQAAHILR